MVNTLSHYEQKALEYAEKWGIIEYKVKGYNMVYYEKFPTEGKFKHIINLKTDEHIGKQLYKRKLK